MLFCRWHSILFSTLSGANAITHDQAFSTSNADVINMLAPSAQEDALQVLDEFCEAFNAVLPRIELLFECETNPFIGNQGEIDLSGTQSGGGGMTHSTPVRIIQGSYNFPLQLIACWDHRLLFHCHMLHGEKQMPLVSAQSRY